MEVMKRIFRPVWGAIKSLKLTYWWIVSLGYKLRLLDFYGIPVIINNFNRLTFPAQLIEFLKKCGLTNIIILDNHSTYPPLLEYYEKGECQVIREPINHGHLALWKSGHYHKYKWNYFFYTDSDVVPVEECPKDFVEYMKSVLDNDYTLDKVGFGIKIDDLPDSFSLKEKVMNYERRYWQKEVKPGLFEAPIDTTFTLYRPFSNIRNGEIYTLKALRTGAPYLIRHLPWYMDSEKLTDEEKYYQETCNSSSSLGKQQKGLGEIY